MTAWSQTNKRGRLEKSGLIAGLTQIALVFPTRSSQLLKQFCEGWQRALRSEGRVLRTLQKEAQKRLQFRLFLGRCRVPGEHRKILQAKMQTVLR